MKNILITGIRGFIGFNAAQQWSEKHPQYNYIGLDAETYADKFLEDDKNKWLEKAGIPNHVLDLGSEYAEAFLDKIIKDHRIDTIVNFAAESHVDRSIDDPTIFYQSNVVGFSHLLNVAKEHGIKVHQVSTDEVIGSKMPNDYCLEDAPYNPSSPYSSSKASAELVAMAYAKTYGMEITVSRCTNNIGEWQMTEKLVPTVISHALKNEQVPVYGHGLQRRFWIDVREHNEAVMQILEKGKPGEMLYNIAPNPGNLVTNLDLVHKILHILGKPESLVEFVKDRPAHDSCYYLDASKIQDLVGYKDISSFEETLMRTIDWYKGILSK